MGINWVRSYEKGIEYLDHRDGVAWYDAPLPWRWHFCTPQTHGFFGMSRTERCACGAIRLGRDRHWMERNSRRRQR